MSANAPLLLLSSISKASLFKKKLCALIIFTCMLVNGFAFSTAEIGKYSLFMITVAATQNIVASVLSKCNNSVAGISNKLCSCIGGILKGRPLQTSSAAGNGGKKDGKQNDKSSGAAAIITQSAAKKIRSIISEENEKIEAGYAYFGDVFGNYEPLKNGCSKEIFLLLAFIVFISAIRQRKLLDVKAAHTGNGWKTRISA